ncbi:MAG: hypothetical protein ABSH28_21375 [Acidobacteriota bacterium]
MKIERLFIIIFGGAAILLLAGARVVVDDFDQRLHALLRVFDGCVPPDTTRRRLC